MAGWLPAWEFGVERMSVDTKLFPVFLKVHLFAIHGTYALILKMLMKLFYYRHQNKCSSCREGRECFTFVFALGLCGKVLIAGKLQGWLL